MNIKSKIVFPVVVLTFISFVDQLQVLGQRKETLKVIGQVSGYPVHDSFTSLFYLSNAEHWRQIIVRVNRVLKGKETATYLYINYKYYSEELPEQMFDGNSRWRFKLTRDPSCDFKLEKLESSKDAADPNRTKAIQRIKWLDSKPPIENDTRLPCYVLTPDDYKLIGSSKYLR